eukprot:CAMPEP_0119060904 /NCGR_PEP_ID=MMETSP1178-20130426/4802_1 /TAXON_ID=33656 /ORGANISM="unid sp, Strain CCMP2000" /LENGTH=80 /DNA_ID=CAMNT_0007042049 /DNA_START=99 /DNA_END=339 /DNA_ORIENTATION=-
MASACPGPEHSADKRAHCAKPGTGAAGRSPSRKFGGEGDAVAKAGERVKGGTQPRHAAGRAVRLLRTTATAAANAHKTAF